MTMNDIHELKLEGAFDIDKGSRYDFAMGQLKQIFDIQPGSKIIWTGDQNNLFDITLPHKTDLEKYKMVKVNLYMPE